MKRFLGKLGRLFGSRGFLKVVLWTVTLIVLFYVEEDWRGARDWAATKAKWEARGETFNLNAFAPAPVPDDENLAAIPLFKLEPIPNLEGVYPVVLDRALRKELPGNDLPSRGNWMRGDLPDMATIRRAIATDYSIAFKSTPPSSDAFAQFDALYPFLTKLRGAVATRPLCRFNVDYGMAPPYGRSLELVTAMIRLSNISTLHALLALDDHRADLALQDIQINYQLLPGAEHDPTLVGGLVALGMNAITGSAIYDGLARHAWSKDQLIQIDHVLEPIHFLADYQFAFRSEAAESAANIDYFKKSARQKDFRALGEAPDTPFTARFASLWPHGWWDDNKCQMAALALQRLASVNPKLHRVFPQDKFEIEHQVAQADARWDAQAPWNFWPTLVMSPLSDIALKYAYGQTWVDETRIACALERYWLVHHAYPASLDFLVPAQIAALPHDVINGEPYHYRLRPDGTYLLYSVGWNQRDDGGKLVLNPDGRIDNEQGDWVWPMPKSDQSP